MHASQISLKEDTTSARTTAGATTTNGDLSPAQTGADTAVGQAGYTFLQNSQAGAPRVHV